MAARVHSSKERARTTLTPLDPWAARHNTWLLIQLRPKGVVFSTQQQRKLMSTDASLQINATEAQSGSCNEELHTQSWTEFMLPKLYIR